MKHTHRILAVVLILLCVIAIVFLVRERANAPVVAPVVTTTTNSESTPVAEAVSTTTYKDLIKQVVITVLDEPLSQTLTVKGEARGTWFFEGTFPVEILFANGTVAAHGIAKANGEWMTKEFVPFVAVVKVDKSFLFPAEKTPTGFLLLKRDNPSGDPVNDDTFKIPVTFASVQ